MVIREKGRRGGDVRKKELDVRELYKIEVLEMFWK